MNNPFLQDGESTHEYKNQMFVVDFYPHPLGNTWQCSDSSHYIRARANTKQEAIDQAHKEWDEYKPTETMTNDKQQTAVEWLQSIELERDLTLADWKQAKEMEKERAIKFACDVHMNVKKDKVKSLMQLVDEKYNETYGGGEQ